MLEDGVRKLDCSLKWSGTEESFAKMMRNKRQHHDHAITNTKERRSHFSHTCNRNYTIAKRWS